MQKLTIQRGDSARIAIVLPADKMANVEDVVCYIGASIILKKSENALVETSEPNIFYIDLKSKQTNTLAGENEFAIAVDYSDLGVKKTPKSENLILVVENNVNTFSNASISDLVLATITVTINETTISASSCLVSYVVVGGAVDSVNGKTGVVVLDADDIAGTSNKRFVTDAQLTVIGNTSGTNTGDETTSTIQTKRPLKTINNNSLDGSGNVVVSNVIYKRISAFPITPITGTTSRTTLSTIPLAGLGLTIGSFFDFRETSERTTRTGTCVYDLWLHNSSNIDLGTPDKIATYTMPANYGNFPFTRHFTVQSGNNLKGYPSTISALNDLTMFSLFSTTSLTGKTHIISTVTPATSVDTVQSLEVLMLGEV